jgi:hypothetical protein
MTSIEEVDVGGVLPKQLLLEVGTVGYPWMFFVGL